MSKHNKLHFRK